MLHSKVPTEVVDKVEVPSQLSITATPGAAGVVLGAAIPEPAGLVQPFTVWVTVYVPATETVIEVVVSEVLHNKVPVNPVAVSVEVPSQLSTTATPGAVGAAGAGSSVTLVGKEIQPAALVAVTSYMPGASPANTPVELDIIGTTGFIPITE